MHSHANKNEEKITKNNFKIIIHSFKHGPLLQILSYGMRRQPQALKPDCFFR